MQREMSEDYMRTLEELTRELSINPNPVPEFKQILVAMDKIALHLETNSACQKEMHSLVETSLGYILYRFEEGVNEDTSDFIKDFYDLAGRVIVAEQNLTSDVFNVKEIMDQFLKRSLDLVNDSFVSESYGIKEVLVNSLNEIIIDLGSYPAHGNGILEHICRNITEYCRGRSGSSETVDDLESQSISNNVYVLYRILINCKSKTWITSVLENVFIQKTLNELNILKDKIVPKGSSILYMVNSITNLLESRNNEKSTC